MSVVEITRLFDVESSAMCARVGPVRCERRACRARPRACANAFARVRPNRQHLTVRFARAGIVGLWEGSASRPQGRLRTRAHARERVPRFSSSPPAPPRAGPSERSLSSTAKDHHRGRANGGGASRPHGRVRAGRNGVAARAHRKALPQRYASKPCTIIPFFSRTHKGAPTPTFAPCARKLCNYEKPAERPRRPLNCGPGATGFVCACA